MINITISILYLVLSFVTTILCFKKYGKYGLYIWMCILIIMSNIQTIKIAELFGFTISLGNISYGALYLTTDILNEKYGKNSAMTATKISFFAMILLTIFMTLFLQYKPSSIDVSQEAMVLIFGKISRVTIASLVSYYISQLCDTYLYDKLKKKYNKIWISNNVSTIISQTIDTFIFVIISFIGTLNISDIIEIMVTMLLFKYLIALLDTPFMIWSTKIKNNELD